jgi:hypothetical protein
VRWILGENFAPFNDKDDDNESNLADFNESVMIRTFLSSQDHYFIDISSASSAFRNKEFDERGRKP